MTVLALAAGCALLAALVSGLVAPEVAAKAAPSGDHDPYQLLLAYTGLLNQAFAKVYVLGTCVAAILWCIPLSRAGRAPAMVGYGGAVLAAIGLVAVVTRMMQLDIRGFGLFVLVNGVWTIAVAVLLMKGSLEDRQS